ncbi:MAG: efflux RND transporter periplasmic adaptor subunit [Bradymonadaceae bacterium]
MKTRRSGIIAGLLLVAAIIVFYALALRPDASVAVTQPQVRNVTELLVASGQLQVRPSSDLSMNVAATIEEILVEEGDRVEKGEVLLRLEQDEVARQVDQARAGVAVTRGELQRLRAGTTEQELAQARAALMRAQSARELAEEEARRAEMLFEEGVMTRSDLDRARATLAQARADEESAWAQIELLESMPRPEDVRVVSARLEEARAALALAEERIERRSLRAPFQGTITRRFVDPGEAAAPGMPLLTLVDMSGAEVFWETDENNVARIEIGQRARVIPLAFPERPFDAVVFQIGPEVDPQRGVVAVRLTPVEPMADEFFPEMTVDVNLMIEEIEDAISVPASAVFEEDEESFVYIVDDEIVRKRSVRVLVNGDRWAAIEGIDIGERVVLRAQEVRDEDRVRPEEVDAPGDDT